MYVCAQPQSLSRADSGIVFRADSPEVGDDASSHVPADQVCGGEESTTVGGKMVSLSNGTVESEADKLKVIPEEALGAGAEQGMCIC